MDSMTGDPSLAWNSFCSTNEQQQKSSTECKMHMLEKGLYSSDGREHFCIEEQCWSVILDPTGQVQNHRPAHTTGKHWCRQDHPTCLHCYWFHDYAIHTIMYDSQDKTENKCKTERSIWNINRCQTNTMYSLMHNIYNSNTQKFSGTMQKTFVKFKMKWEGVTASAYTSGNEVGMKEH